MIVAASALSAPALSAMVLLLVANGVFVATEWGLLAARRERLDSTTDPARRDRRGLGAAAETDSVLAGSQLGVTAASIGLGAAAPAALGVGLERVLSRLSVPDDVAAPAGVVLAVAIVVFLHLVFGEMLPRAMALADPERLLRITAPPARAFVWVFRPAIRALEVTARGIARLLGVDRVHRAEPRTAEELATILAESHEGVLPDDESTLLASALAFVSRRVDEVMVPADDMVTVGIDEPLEAVEERFRTTGHSRLVVLDATGRAIGFVHVKDVLRLGAVHRPRPLPWSVVRQAVDTEPDAELGTLLVRMQVRRRHLAVVRDESRQLLGLVTLEDVVASIVGDLAERRRVATEDQARDQEPGADGRQRDPEGPAEGPS